ncbi:unnamed protein product [Trichobilharzia szidati]|nr:unnamed protein product [Trichobilharzia szidati]
MSGDTSLSFQKISGRPSPNDIKSYEYSQNSEAGDLSVYSEYCTKVTDTLSHKSELDHAEDDEPPSPLSLQQDGVFSLVQSPPFEHDQTDRMSPENHHHIISELFTDSKSKTRASLSEADSVVITDQTKAPVCSTIAWISSDLHNISQSEQANSISGDIPSLPCPGNLPIINNNNNSNTKDHLLAVVDSSQNSVMNSPTPNVEGPKQDASSTTVIKQTNLSAIACRKSVKELYGQPSWWGDGDNDYSYPHTSSFKNQEAFQPAFRKYSAETEVNSVSNEKSVRPPAEAFVVDFGSPSRPRSERPASLSGSLSQCIPAKLRQGLDERERRKREKQMEVRRLSTSGVANKNTTSSGPSSNSRGALSLSTKSSTVVRTTTTPATASAAAKTATSTTTKTRTSTVNSIRSTAASNKTTRLSGTSAATAVGVENRSSSSINNNNNKTSSLTQRRRIDSASNLTVNSNTASRSNLTDRSRGRMSIQNSTSREPLSTQQTSRTNTRPPFSAGGRRISTGATSLASQNTAPSQLQRSKLSSPPTRGSVPPATSTGLTSSRSYLRGASSATRQASTQRRGTTRGFMTPTTSSDAKQVRARECIRSVPNESPISSSPQYDTRRIYESPLSNSNKKPITSTFLRRGTSQNRGGGGAGTVRRKLSTDNIDQYSTSNKSSSRISDLTASVVAAIEAYDDPKAYLFYRMFQGSEETERTTNGIFQAFSSYSSNFQDLSPEVNSKPLVNIDSSAYNDDVDPDAGVDADDERLLTTSQMKMKHLSKDDSFNGRNKCFGSPENNVADEYDTLNCRTDSKLTTSSNVWHNQLEQGNSQLSTTSKPRKGQKDSNSSTILPSDIQRPMESHGLSSNNKNKVHGGGVVDDAQADDDDDADDVIDPTIKSMNISLLVSTSVTSLTPSHTGTYVIEGDETAGVDQCLSQHSDDKDLYPRKESDLLTPRGGSPSDGNENNEHLKRLPGGHSTNQQSRRLPKGFENSMSSSVDQIQTHLPSSKLFQPTTRKKRINSDHEVISSSTDLHQSQTVDKSLHLVQASSTVCLSEKLDDTSHVRGGRRRRNSLEDSDVFGASSVSLTPSHTGTYVLDMDETLAAQGGILPVVISSSEKASTSITTDSGLTSSYCPESIRTQTAETITPRGSPNIKEKLWDVVETEEDSNNDEDRLLVVASNEIHGNVFSSQFPESNNNNHNNRQYEVLNKCDTELDAHFAMESLRAEFEDTYKLLPSPVQFLATNSAVDSSFSESESRSPQTKSTGLPIIHGKKSTRSIPLVNTTNAPVQYMSGIVKSTTQASSTSHTPVNNLQNDIVIASACTFNNDTKYSTMRACTNDGHSQQTSSVVGLKLPDLSSSATSSSSSNTPSTPSSSYTNNILKKTRELLEGFDKQPTSYKSHPNKFQNMLRTHSCHRRKSQYYYAHGGSASVPDPASPVRSWSSISSGTEHSLTNRIVCRTRKQLRDQTDSGFIETNDLMMKPTTNSNKMLSQNSSSAFLEKKPDNRISPNAYNSRINIPQYDTDVHFRKSGEIDSRTYTRRKFSRSGDRSDYCKQTNTVF